ncbi:MAG TPA: hypothetical protein PKE40_00595 [Arachnia sp.]|nr:hypothetical protein [Arachnia sp.]HMT84824.1 hypothetical protein [Arachnia sp.]
MRRTVFATTLTTALALTGCSGDQPPTNDNHTAAPTSGSPTAAPSTSDEASSSPAPLDEYLGFLRLWRDTDKEQFAKDFADEQELIAPCMTEQGFEYIPVTFKGDAQPFTETDPDAPAWYTLEFAQQFGYGIVDYPGRQLVPDGAEKEPPDENQAYVDSLSESDRRAYEKALHGDPENPAFADAWEQAELDPTAVGCAIWAGERLNSTKALRDPEFAELFQALDQAFATRENSPQLVALDREWSECMADRGYVFVDRDEPYDYLSNQAFDELWPDRGGTGSGDDYRAYDPRNADVPQEDLDAFQAEEIKTAVTDYECAASIRFDERVTEIEHAVQQVFVDEHRAQLDALAAKHGS